MDYNSLTAEIKLFARRTDDAFSNEVPNIIQRGMNRIYAQAKNIGFQLKTPPGYLLTPNQQSFLKPNDWKKTLSLSIVVNGRRKLLLHRNYEFCITYAPTAKTGVPKFFTDDEYRTILLYPIPDQAYPYLLIYRGFPVFGPANQTNFLTRRYEGLVLYACLLETLIFLKDDERLPAMQNLYNTELENINNEAALNTVDRTSKGDIS